MKILWIERSFVCRRRYLFLYASAYSAMQAFSSLVILISLFPIRWIAPLQSLLNVAGLKLHENKIFMWFAFNRPPINHLDPARTNIVEMKKRAMKSATINFHVSASIEKTIKRTKTNLKKVNLGSISKKWITILHCPTFIAVVYRCSTPI